MQKQVCKTMALLVALATGTAFHSICPSAEGQTTSAAGRGGYSVFKQPTDGSNDRPALNWLGKAPTSGANRPLQQKSAAAPTRPSPVPSGKSSPQRAIPAVAGPSASPATANVPATTSNNLLPASTPATNDASQRNLAAKLARQSLPAPSASQQVNVATTTSTKSLSPQLSSQSAVPSPTSWTNSAPAQSTVPVRVASAAAPASTSAGGRPRATDVLVQQPRQDRHVMPVQHVEEIIGGEVTDGGQYAEPFYGDMSVGEGYVEDGLGPVDHGYHDGCHECVESPIHSTGTWFRRGRWYVEADALFLNRSSNRKTTFLFNTDFQDINQQFISAFDSQTDPLGFAAGVRFTFGSFLGRDLANRDHSIDFTYIGGFDWDAAATVSNTAPVLTSRITGGTSVIGFSGADTLSYTYGADLNSYEFNYRVRTRPGRDQMALQPNGVWVRHGVGSQMHSLLAGFRVVGIEEDFQHLGSRDLPVQSGQYDVSTLNRLFGFQVGADLEEKFDTWSWGLYGRTGGLYNFAERESSLILNGVPNNTFGDAFVRKQQLAFLADLKLQAQYQIRPNLAIRGGYNLIYISGLGLAGENLGLDSVFPVFNVNGSALFHGASVGLERTW